MQLRPDGLLIFATPMSMSRPSGEELPPEAVEMAALVRLTLGGETAAFEQIILRYETRVMTMAARVLGGRDEARDATQEVFLRAFKYLHRLDLRKPIEPWLMRITVNVCRDAARRRRRVRETFIEVEAPEAVDHAPGPYDGLAQEQQRQVLQQALQSLPQRERLAIVLRDLEGLSTAEVASILQSSETTVRSQVSRGRLRLKTAVDRLVGGQS